MPIEKLFPTLVYTDKLASKLATRLNPHFIKEAHTLSKIDRDGIRWSKKNYIGGYTSYQSIPTLHKTSSVFTELEEALTPHVSKYIKALEWNTMGRKIRMTTCWVSIMPKNTYHPLHIHPLSVLSGTYYVHAPEGSSTLKIEDPRLSKFMNTPPRSSKAKRDNSNYVHYTPAPGSFILFESWLRHEVPPNQSQSARISISFNYEWI